MSTTHGFTRLCEVILYAVVTGANKGLGYGICKQLASKGVIVVLTARDETKGLKAVEELRGCACDSADSFAFHQLDVTDLHSIAAFAEFIKNKFGKLDILVNNAGILGANVDMDAWKASDFFGKQPKDQSTHPEIFKQTYELVEECVKTNYHGVKATTEALLPLLQLSDSPRIVNVSSSAGKLSHIPNEQTRAVLSNAETLTENRVDELLNELLRDIKDGSYVQKGWPPVLPAYFVAKAALNAYTRILAKKYPPMVINCVCPGYVRTDFNSNSGNLTVEESAARAVRLALLPHGLPSGLFYANNEVTPFY